MEPRPPEAQAAFDQASLDIRKRGAQKALDAARAGHWERADDEAQAAFDRVTSRRGELQAFDFNTIIELQVAVREALLGKWLMQQSLNMVHARRGTGKTWFVLGLAIALASGAQFLGWAVERPRRVLLVDGEMPLRALQDRLREMSARMGATVAPGMLQIITPDLLGRAAPDLAVEHDRHQLDVLAVGVDLIILDNLSALLRSGAAENDAESWVTVSDWALRHRAAGRSVLFVHHSGKSGAQRGTSRREDLLDVVISLRNPAEYDPRDGARFEVHFEKARHLHGPEAEAFEAALDPTAPGGWQISSIEGSTDEAIVERLALGLNLTEIGRELGLDKSNVSRRVRKLREAGVLPADGSQPKVRNQVRNIKQKELPQ
jgi:DNA-binding transcriptional ArsR family regulator